MRKRNPSSCLIKKLGRLGWFSSFTDEHWLKLVIASRFDKIDDYVISICDLNEEDIRFLQKPSARDIIRDFSRDIIPKENGLELRVRLVLREPLPFGKLEEEYFRLYLNKVIVYERLDFGKNSLKRTRTDLKGLLEKVVLPRDFVKAICEIAWEKKWGLECFVKRDSCNIYIYNVRQEINDKTKFIKELAKEITKRLGD
jgi:hypothetical protein